MRMDRDADRSKSPLILLIAGHGCMQVAICEANNELYAATVDGRIAVKIGPGSWDPSKAGVNVGQKAWLLALKGPGFAVWEAHF